MTHDVSSIVKITDEIEAIYFDFYIIRCRRMSIFYIIIRGKFYSILSCRVQTVYTLREIVLYRIVFTSRIIS